MSFRCGMLKNGYELELAISRLGAREQLSLNIKDAIMRCVIPYSYMRGQIKLYARVEEYLQLAETQIDHGALEEDSFWSLVMKPIASAIDFFLAFCCSRDTEGSGSRSKDNSLPVIRKDIVENHLILGESYVTVSDGFTFIS